MTNLMMGLTTRNSSSAKSGFEVNNELLEKSYHYVLYFVIIYKTTQRTFQRALVACIIKELLLSQSGQWYCKYCGSNSITNVRVTNKLSKSKIFEPSVGMQEMSFSLGSIGKKKGFGYSYQSKFCKICNNFNVSEETNSNQPLTITSSTYTTAVIIPYTLYIHLKTYEYEIEDILKLTQCLRKTLGKIHKKWEKKGINPCRGGKFGYKISIKLKRAIKISCWVIIDAIENTKAYRLVYGGGKINCP